MAGAEKKAEIDGFTIAFIDESGFYLLPGLVRTYAPCGATPILRSVTTRDPLSVMSGITLTGPLYTLVRELALTSAEAVRFLIQLQRFYPKVMVIRDRRSIRAR